MQIAWLGHASFLITADDGTKIITDPYQHNYKGLFTYGKIEESAHAVTVSHEHADHNAAGALPGEPQVVRGAGRHEAAGLLFEGIASYHDRAQGAERGSNTIFCFAVDGVRVCHLGDLGHPLTEGDLASLGPVDVLLAPIGGPIATLDLPDLWPLIDRLAPRVVIPMHFRNERCHFPKYAVADFVPHYADVEQLADSQTAFHPATLPSTTRVVVLQPAL